MGKVNISIPGTNAVYPTTVAIGDPIYGVDAAGFSGTINVISTGGAGNGGALNWFGADSAATTIIVEPNSKVYCGYGQNSDAYSSFVLYGGQYNPNDNFGQLRGDGGYTWHGNITLAGSISSGEYTIGNFGSSPDTVSGNIGEINGSQPLVVAGSAPIILTGSNTYSGATTISSGTLVLGNQNAVQNSTLTMTGGGAVVFSSSVAGNAFTLGGLAAATSGPGYDIALQNDALTPVALTVGGNGASTTYAGVLSGAGSLTKTGTGTLTLTGNNTYTGLTTLAGGVLNAGAADGSGYGALGNSGTITFAGGTLQYSSQSAASDYSPRIFNSSGPIAIDTNGQNVNFNTGLDSSNIGGLTKAGSGTLSLNVPNSYSGVTTIAGGVLSLGTTNSPLGNSGNITFTGGTLQLGSPTNSDTSFTLGIGYLIENSTSPVAIETSGGTATFDTAPGGSNSGGLTKSGIGTLALQNNCYYTGPTTVNGGVLSLGASNGYAVHIEPSSSITVNNGGTLAFNYEGVWTSSTTSSPITINAGGQVTSNGQFNQLWNLSLNGGTLVSNNGDDPGTYGLAGTVSASGGVTSYIATTGTGGNWIPLGYGAGPSSTTFNVASGSTLDVGTNLENFGAVNGTGGTAAGLTKTGNGKLVLSDSNTYSGGTDVADGELIAISSTALPAHMNLAIGPGGTLLFDPAWPLAGPLVAQGAAVGGPVAVPEPGTLALVVAAAVCGAATCRRLVSRRKRKG